MTDFERLLQDTLQGMNEEFRQADRDLHEEVAAASEAVERIFQGRARLTLVRTGEGPEGIEYDLLLELLRLIHRLGLKDDQQKRLLAQFRVPSNGYPIDLPGVRGVHLANRQAITDYLKGMASRPDSPLVQYLAFAFRQPEPPPPATASG